MTNAVPDLDLFRASLVRVTQAPDFFPRFYDRFMGDSPEIAALFHNKDVAGIHRKLKMTLEMLADNAEAQPGLAMYLHMLGRTHARLKVRPEHFVRWRDALIETAAECDPLFDEDRRRAWDLVIEDLIAKLEVCPDKGPHRSTGGREVR